MAAAGGRFHYDLVPPYLRYVDYLPTSSKDKYELVQLMAKGAFGQVFEARLTANSHGEHYAIKMKFHEPPNTIKNDERREIHALKALRYEENIIQLLDIVGLPGRRHSVMELAKTDFSKIIFDPQVRITDDERKIITRQLFNGLRAIHEKGFIHRDLKPANVLVNMQGILKIGDFGASIQDEIERAQGLRRFSEVVTLWYRAPELLLGDVHYQQQIDLWSAGVIAGELWIRQVMFRGSDKYSTMEEIAIRCGFPKFEDWPRVIALPRYPEMHQMFGYLDTNFLMEVLRDFVSDESAIHFIMKLLKFNPFGRMTADAALQHAYLRSTPTTGNINNILQNEHLVVLC